MDCREDRLQINEWLAWAVKKISRGVLNSIKCLVESNLSNHLSEDSVTIMIIEEAD